MRRTLLVGAVAGLVAALAIGAPAQAQPAHQHHPQPKALVSLLHAVPKVPVDVYVGSKKVLDDFQPGSLAGPLKLAPGSYTVRITAATAKNADHPIIGPATFSFAPGGNYTVVAHLTAAGKPTATEYRNDTSPVRDDRGRLTVRHDAAAPAVDVLLNGTPAIRHLTNPNEAKAVVKEGRYTAAVALAGTTAPVIGPTRLKVAEDTNTIVYAWGSAADGTLALAVQTVRLRHRC